MKVIASLFILASASSGMTILSSSLSTTSNSEITFYTESGGQLTQVSSASAVDPLLSTVLSSTAGAAGGNVELFTGSDGLTDMSAGGVFATSIPVVLNTSHAGGGNIQVRSVNGMDWFMDDLMTYNLSYGASNLANVYFNDLVDAALAATTDLSVTAALTDPSSLSSIYNQFVSKGGFSQISDPNISYVTVDQNGNPVVGLAGFLDTSSRLQMLTGASAEDIAQAFPEGFQSSEVAIVNGQALYSFNAVSSGVVLDDGVSSYNATYEVTSNVAVPEPSSLVFLSLATLSFLSRRERKV